MPEHLKDLMHETADLDFAPVDVAAITRAGNRVVRRRRVFTGVAALAATAVVGAGVWAIAAGGGDGDAHLAEDGGAVIGTSDVTWVEGSVLHSPDASIDLGFEVHSYVRTASGFVFADDQGVVHSYVDGRIDEIGQADPVAPGLVADREGAAIGWMGRSGKTPEIVVLDRSQGFELRLAAEPHRNADGQFPVRLIAIDEGQPYWQDGRGLMTASPAGEQGVLSEHPSPFVVDVEYGLFVRLAEDDEGGDLGFELVNEAGDVLVDHEGNEQPIRVSPDGRWATTGGVPRVEEIGTGREVTLDLPALDDGFSDAMAYEWLDTETVAYVLEADEDSVHLVTCELPAGACELVAEEIDVPGEGIGDGFLLPGFGFGY